MKALIIILVLVAVSFVGLLIYGKSRETGSHQNGQPAGFGTATNPQPDQLDNWKPPSFASAFPWLQEKFGPRLGLKPPAALTNNPLQPAMLPIATLKGAVPGDPDPKKVRLARVSLTAGPFALLSQDNNRLCLCKSGTALPDTLFTDDVCDTRWKTKNASRTCDGDQTSGSIPVSDQGGTITLAKGPIASVTIR